MKFRVYERTKNGEKEICSITPYDQEFVNYAKANKAKWSAGDKMWIFKGLDASSIKNKIEEIYSVSKKIDGYNTIATTAYNWDRLSDFVVDIENSIVAEYNNGLIIKFKDCDREMQESLKDRMYIKKLENGEYTVIFKLFSNSKKYIALKDGYKIDFEAEEVKIDEEAVFTEIEI